MMNNKLHIELTEDLQKDLISHGWIPPVVPNPVYGRQMVKFHDEYLFLDSCGELQTDIQGCKRTDEARFALGNYEAIKEPLIKKRDAQLAYMRIIDKLVELNKGWVPDWIIKYQRKRYVGWNHLANCPRVVASACNTQEMPNELYGTKEACQWVADNMEDDIKLWLGIID